MNTVEIAYQAWADYMDNAPLSDVFTDAYHNRLMALWMAYVEALSNGTAVKAYSDLVALKTPQIADKTDLDPQPAALPQGRYRGTLRMFGAHGYVYPEDRSQVRDDHRVTSHHIMGGFPGRVFVESAAVEFSLMENERLGYLQAHRVVIIGYEPSEKAYQMLLGRLKKEIPLVNPRSKIIRETLYQKAQRLEREAKQREQARKEAHQPQTVKTDYMDVFYEAPIEADTQSQHAQDV